MVYLDKIINFLIETKDWLMLLAVILSPIAALLIQSKKNEKLEAQKRRIDIFRTLMITRASVLSEDHIKALNMIDIEFYNNRKYKNVLKAWDAYLKIRNQSQDIPENEITQFNIMYETTLVALLVEMGKALNYCYDSDHIRQSIYKPQWHVTEERYQLFMKQKLFQLFSGNIALPIDVKFLPISADELKEQQKLRELAIRYFEKELKNA